jgi:thioredoxin-like negative regulator of GroEL
MTELTLASFQEFVRVNRFAVIHFWATWNGYDTKMKGLLRSQIPAELANLISFGMFDTDPAQHHDMCRQHKVRNLPFLALYRDGLLVRTLTGMRKPDEIIARLRELVSEVVYGGP